MISLDVFVPAFAAFVAVAAVVYVRWLEQRLEREMRQPPAE